ncbi:MAG: hypothetical protein KAV44_10075 [Bacteroidales bacterium]|nr:hypothetical protein [Bacteroidales bacterium]
MKKNIDLSREDHTDFNKFDFFKRLKTRIYKVIIVAFGLLWIIAGSEIYAQEISISGAEKAANVWLANTTFYMNYQLKGIHNIKNIEGEMLAYRFDLQPQGYLVLTADQSLPPVIAYSFTGNFSIAVKFPAYIPLNTDEIAALVFSCGVAGQRISDVCMAGRCERRDLLYLHKHRGNKADEKDHHQIKIKKLT